MTLIEQITNIDGSKDMSKFVKALIEDYANNGNDWHNRDLESYLQAMEAWIADSDGYFRNTKKEKPSAEVWQYVAMVLIAAKYYE